MKGAINPTNFEHIPSFPEDEKSKYAVHAVIETPRDVRHKYAFVPEYGLFQLKTTIPEGLKWPYDYGFIPQTLGDDGDPLDVLFMDDDPTFAGCLVKARLLGIIRLLKNGEENDRLIACAPRIKGVAQRTDRFNDITDLPDDLIRSMTRFLIEYPTSEKNEIKFKGVDDRKEALATLKVGHKKWKHKAKRR